MAAAIAAPAGGGLSRHINWAMIVVSWSSCCAVLRSAILCCAVLCSCCAVLCCAVIVLLSWPVLCLCSCHGLRCAALQTLADRGRSFSLCQVIVISESSSGSSLLKGLHRVAGTVAGAAAGMAVFGLVFLFNGLSTANSPQKAC